jgi:hypothetical protein
MIPVGRSRVPRHPVSVSLGRYIGYRRLGLGTYADQGFDCVDVPVLHKVGK